MHDGDSSPEPMIMLVDDDATLSMLTTRVLRAIGYRVSSFVNPLDAVAMMKSMPNYYGVLVTDLRMPLMDGFELVDSLRAIRPDLPILLTSSTFRPEDLRKATTLGIVTFAYTSMSLYDVGRDLGEKLRQVLDGEAKPVLNGAHAHAHAPAHAAEKTSHGLNGNRKSGRP